MRAEGDRLPLVLGDEEEPVAVAARVPGEPLLPVGGLGEPGGLGVQRDDGGEVPRLRRPDRHRGRGRSIGFPVHNCYYGPPEGDVHLFPFHAGEVRHSGPARAA